MYYSTCICIILDQIWLTARNQVKFRFFTLRGPRERWMKLSLNTCSNAQGYWLMKNQHRKVLQYKPLGVNYLLLLKMHGPGSHRSGKTLKNLKIGKSQGTLKKWKSQGTCDENYLLFYFFVFSCYSVNFLQTHDYVYIFIVIQIYKFLMNLWLCISI